MVSADVRFVVPHIPSATLERSHLVARLSAGSDCPLTLVAAAPGSGKSALLAQWALKLDGPVAWLSCDVDDADPRWFWDDLVVAIRRAWGSPTLAESEFVEDRDPRQLGIELANELGGLRQPGVVVVDDFHLAAPSPTALTGFIDALPPSIRLVLGSRTDPAFPLGRMRVQGRLLELRQADLRLTRDETQLLLAGLGVELEPGDLETLDSLTEGWAAGVHLAGLALRASVERGETLRRLVETNRSLVDFLMNEVIDLQSPEIREFLMVTAELDSFDADLCDAVGGWSDSAASLEHIAAANLFLVQTGPRGWYRYHHLFRAFLRAGLRAEAPGRVPMIHGAAADAYAARGDLTSAVRHNLNAGDSQAALERLAISLTTTSSLDDQRTGGAAARAWLSEHGASHIRDAPEPVLDCAMVLDASGGVDAAGQWLQRVEGHEAELTPSSRFRLQGGWSFHLLYEGDPAGSLERARRAGVLLREHTIDSPWAPHLPLVLLQGQLWLDDPDAALETLDAWKATPGLPQAIREVRMPGYTAYAQVLRGELADAEQQATLAVSNADRLGLPETAFGRAEPALTLAEIALERDQLDDAEAHIEEVMRIVDRGRRPLVEILGHLLFARLAAARGDLIVVAVHVERARQILPRAKSTVIDQIDRVALRVMLDEGDTAGAKELWSRLAPCTLTDMLRARLLVTSNDDAGARGMLLSITDLPTRRLRIEHGVLSAVANASSDGEAAHGFLRQALSEAEPVGFQRTLVNEGPRLWNLLRSLPGGHSRSDYAIELLRVADATEPRADAPNQHELVDPLSAHELTVLRLLASQLDATEIAAELYLSVNTVRTHVKAIYRKLAVNSRADAVRTGVELGLI